jgi:pullulanase
MVEDMAAVQAALGSLTLENDGVDGAGIYIYGEGWDFGEVANNARGVNATQLNVGGMGIGTFNDRLRDAARGGSPFGGYLEQGFINGLYYDPSEAETRAESAQKTALFQFADHIRLSLAGNLADYVLRNYKGLQVRGGEVQYNGQPAGYTQDPQEHIPYVSAHDNETLFDAIQYKAPETGALAERVRMQNMGVSLVALSQGVPFFHAGVDMLRSKSFDRDSYDSGDWFNRLDFSYAENNFGAGLPPADKNQTNWPVMRPRLARGDLKPGPQEIQSGVAHLEEMLRIRKSSPLFRLRTAAEVQERVRFHNTGLDQLLGVIVMSLADTGTVEDLDPARDLIVVAFNATNEEQRFTLASLAGVALGLHPAQAASDDPLVSGARFDPETGEFAVPARSTVVFEAPQGALDAPPFIEGELIQLAGPPAPELATVEPGPTAMGPESTEPTAELAAAIPGPTAASPTQEHAPGWPWVATAAALSIFAGGAIIAWRRIRRT